MTTTSQLLNGNCLERLKQLPNTSIDLVIADLPYGQTACDWDTKIDLSLLWTELKRVGKDNTAYIFFCTTKFGYELIKSNEKWFRYDLVWNKPGKGIGFLNAKKMPMRNHEMIYVFYNKLPTYNIADNHTKLREMEYNQKRNTADDVYGMTNNPVNAVNRNSPVWEPKLPGSIIDCPIDTKKEHKTEKPQGILQWLIKYYSKAGDTVLDPTMGCGSCGLACRSLGRSFVGIEMNEDFFNKAMQRLAI
jgi:site-specific DNA-methyltransferase (adenine-specific)